MRADRPLMGQHVKSGPLVSVRFIEHSPSFVVARRVKLLNNLRVSCTTVGVWAYGRAQYVTRAGKVYETTMMSRDAWRLKVDNMWSNLERIES